MEKKSKNDNDSNHYINLYIIFPGVFFWTKRAKKSIALYSCTSSASHFRSDDGLDKISLDAEGKLVIYEKPSDTFCLDFVGAVTRHATASSLRVALWQGQGEQLYVEGAAHSNSFHEIFIPEWSVPLLPVVPAAGDKKKTKDPKDAKKHLPFTMGNSRSI